MRPVLNLLRLTLIQSQRIFVCLFLGFLCAGYSGAQKPPKKSPEPTYWIVFDAMSCYFSDGYGMNQNYTSHCSMYLSCYPRDIYVMDKRGGHLKRLTSDHGSHSPSWAPDGRGIVLLKDECTPVDVLTYGWHDRFRNSLSTSRRVFWMDADGANSSLISTIGPDAQDTLWLPDRKHVAVRLADRSNLVVHIKGSSLPPNRQSEEPLSRFLEAEGAWPRIQACDEAVNCPPGVNLVGLIPPADNFLPKFYGSHGLYHVIVDTLPHEMQYGADMNASLQVLSLDGDPAKVPVPFYDAAWSRDGRRIAYSSFTGDQSSVLYVADLHGDEVDTPRALTEQKLDAHGPAWSDDGSRIAFAGLWDNTSQIFVVNADGNKLVRLSRDSTMRCSHMSWSPDGRWIVAECAPNVTAEYGDAYAVGGRFAIYLFDTSKPGAKPRRLTSCGYTPPRSRDDLCGARNPSFAPAGTVIP
jgi:Tol biopolymer transport system component